MTTIHTPVAITDTAASTNGTTPHMNDDTTTDSPQQCLGDLHDRPEAIDTTTSVAVLNGAPETVAE
jgi:hypothetical protein